MRETSVMSPPATASDYMSSALIPLTPETDIHRAIKVLLEARVSGAPVIDESGELVGILATKDCLRIAFGASYHQERGGSVADFMSGEVRTVDAATDIVEIAELFLNSRFRRFPVLRDDRLVGIITRHDVLRALEALW